MNNRSSFIRAILVPLAVFAAAGTARAASVSIAAGQTYNLTGDLNISGADTFDANGTVASPCTIVGNGHSLVASGTTGHIKIQNCILTGLGGSAQTAAPALDLTVQGTADLTITGSTFDACGEIAVHVNDTATAEITNNLLKDTGISYIEDELQGSMYVPAFHADGSSTATKVFQGNRIYRSSADFGGVTNWLIGGYGDQYTNILVGHRGVITVDGDHVKVVGNFIHPQYPLTSPDVENLLVTGTAATPDLIVEHNVLRSGEWVMRECLGEVRYNLLSEMNGHAWIKGPHSCNAHHNIFVQYAVPDHNSEGGIDVVYLTSNLNIYNNTFDGGGPLANIQVPAIHAKQGFVIERVDSNAITNFVINAAYAAVSNLGPDTYNVGAPPGDARMHFADYNLFYNPDSPSQVDYSLPVEPNDTTPIPQGSPGFGAHDVNAAPAFKGPIPTAFPFNDTDIEAGTVTVSMILSYYRGIYTPAAGSPLIGAGDPMFGANNNIGAVGQGTAKDPNDQFGTFQPGTGGGPPLLTGAGGSTGAGGTSGTAGSGSSGAGSSTGAGGASATSGAGGAGSSTGAGGTGSSTGAGGTGVSTGAGGASATSGAGGAGSSTGAGGTVLSTGAGGARATSGAGGTGSTTGAGGTGATTSTGGAGPTLGTGGAASQQTSASSGCSCATADGARPSPSLLAVLMLGIGGLVMRRRRAR